MATKHLRHFEFMWSTDGIPRTASGRFTPENNAIVGEVEYAKRWTMVLTVGRSSRSWAGISRS